MTTEHPTHTDPADELAPYRKFIKTGAIFLGLLAATALITHFILGPMIYNATLNQLAEKDVVHDKLVAKYDIESISFTVETVNTGPGYRAGQPTANDSYDRDITVIDGVRRECELLNEDTDPTLDCINWVVPLR